MTTSRQGSSHTGRKKIQVSFVIRDEVEKRHRSGINSLQFDPAMNRLYSAGRDSIIRIWNTRHQRDYYVSSMEHHVDWVNDIVLACGGRNLISASSDTTVKVWNAQKGYCLSTLRTHKDYVKALAYAKDRELVASAGLDKAIFLWDVTTLTALSASNNTVTTSSLHGCKDSVYSLAMNQPGTVIVAGSTERVIRLWDPRTCEKLVKLKGHSDNVKALLVNREGSQCLSGSSDGTVRLWNIGQQRYVATIRIHTEGVWALQVNDSFSTVFSAGRDKKIYMTDLRNPDQPVLLAEETAPILKMTLTPDGNNLWVATTESTIRCWPVNNRAPCPTEQELGSPRPQCEEAVLVIKGGPSIRQFHILNDKRHILTKDTDNCVALNDVLTARKIEDLGQVDFDEEVRKRFKLIYVPNWFSVDLKTGMLCVHLAQDENDCFSAWVSVSELGLGHEDQADQKVNYGSILLQALLEHWPKVHNSGRDIVENGDDDHGAGDYSRAQNGMMRKAGSEYVSVPDHTPVIFSEIGGRTLYRLLCRDAGNETEGGLLNETVPQWAMDVVILRSLPKFIKVPFYLIPHNSYGAKSLKRDRLIANDFIQIRKVCEHVWEKVLGAGSDSGSTSAQNSSSDKMGDNDLNELSTLPEAKVEILCQDESLDPSLDLRTVRHFIWKTSSDLVLHYRPIM